MEKKNVKEKMNSWVAFYLPSGMVSDFNWSWFGRTSLTKTIQAGGRYMLRATKSLRRKRTPPPFETNVSPIVISTSASGRSKASSFSNHHTRKLTSKGQYVRWGSYIWDVGHITHASYACQIFTCYTHCVIK